MLINQQICGVGRNTLFLIVQIELQVMECYLYFVYALVVGSVQSMIHISSNGLHNSLERQLNYDVGELASMLLDYMLGNDIKHYQCPIRIFLAGNVLYKVRNSSLAHHVFHLSIQYQVNVLLE